jgi:glutathione S-transferase
MSITLFHHPYSRAAGTLWALEEVGEPYELRFVDVLGGKQKDPDFLALNSMGKLPTLSDGDAVVTEAAAIAIYLADRYALGRLAPPCDDPKRGTYLRWSFYSPSVVEPGAMAKARGWTYSEGAAGWGNYDAMITSMKRALEGGFILGDTFSMADVIFGGTLRYLLQFGLLEKDPVFTGYVDRLAERPALQRADARNAAVAKAHGLERA